MPNLVNNNYQHMHWQYKHEILLILKALHPSKYVFPITLCGIFAIPQELFKRITLKSSLLYIFLHFCDRKIDSLHMQMNLPISLSIGKVHSFPSLVHCIISTKALVGGCAVLSCSSWACSRSHVGNTDDGVGLLEGTLSLPNIPKGGAPNKSTGVL